MRSAPSPWFPKSLSKTVATQPEKKTHVFDAGLGQGKGEVERDPDEHVGAADQAECDVGVATLQRMTLIS